MGEDRKLTKQEVAAMWVYGQDYADRGIGAIDYWRQLSEGRKNIINDMLKEILEVPNV